jgi:hypothetical protein
MADSDCTAGSAADGRMEHLREQVTAFMRQREEDPRYKPVIWERVESAGRGPRPTLTHDQIARAAVEIADEADLSAVSMRRLAERLGIATMGLYRYVSGKDDVYELMLDVVAAELTLPDGGWRVVADAYARPRCLPRTSRSWKRRCGPSTASDSTSM